MWMGEISKRLNRGILKKFLAYFEQERGFCYETSRREIMKNCLKIPYSQGKNRP